MQQRKPAPFAARRAHAAFAGLMAAAALGPRPAAAADGTPPIVLALDPCADIDAKEVRRLVPIEMGAPLVGGATAPNDTTRVTVGCVVDSPSVVRLEVRDPTTGRTLDRFITLLGVPRTDRARLVAIAAVELVAASKSGGAPEPPPRAPETQPRADLVATPLPPAPLAEPRWRLAAVASMRHFGGLPRVTVGGGLAAQHLRRRFALGADLIAEGMPQPTALGDVDAFLLSVGLTGAVRGARGPLSGEVGGGARGGLARLAGQARAQASAPIAAGTVSAPWFGPLATARGAVTFAPGFALTLAGEVGYASGGVQGTVTGRPDLSVHGTWWGAALGVGYAY